MWDRVCGVVVSVVLRRDKEAGGRGDPLACGWPWALFVSVVVGGVVVFVGLDSFVMFALSFVCITLWSYWLLGCVYQEGPI